MQVRYAIERDVSCNQAPRYRARFPMMKLIKRVRKMCDVQSARTRGATSGYRLLGMSGKR